MRIARRVFFFILTNVLVLATISILLKVFNVQPYLTRYGLDYASLATFCLVWGFGGAFISLALSRVMAKWMMGVKLIDPNTTDPAARQLVSEVQELAAKAGIRVMPQVGVYDSPELNAFATGPTRNRALVAVSTGLLQRMDRAQVRGVLAHEVAHIANGDMVTMALVQGVMNAFVMFLARVIAYAIGGSRDGERQNSSYMLVFALEIGLSVLAMFVVSYVSRMREFRADAGGANLASRSEMVAALQGLSAAYAYNKSVPATGDDSFQSFKISGRGGFMRLLSTHPPLEERIARLQNGAY